MKRLISISLLISFMLYSCQKEQSPVIQEVLSDKKIKTVADDFFIALGSADSTKLKSLLTTDFHMFEHDQRWNIDSLLSLMPKTVGRKWELSELAIDQGEELIHISYFNSSLAPKGKSWFESMLLTNTDSGLKIKFMHSTKLYLK